MKLNISFVIRKRYERPFEFQIDCSHLLVPSIDDNYLFTIIEIRMKKLRRENVSEIKKLISFYRHILSEKELETLLI
jgi:hypothetical protein